MFSQSSAKPTPIYYRSDFEKHVINSTAERRGWLRWYVDESEEDEPGGTHNFNNAVQAKVSTGASGRHTSERLRCFLNT